MTPAKRLKRRYRAIHLVQALRLGLEAWQEGFKRGKVAACPSCERNAREGFGPPHEASATCKSGGRNHCTCDACF